MENPMSVDIVIPSPGESVTEGVISAWLKQDGDWVERDETVLELETDKITVEVPAPASGVLRINTPEGETVQVGAVVGTVDDSAEKPAAAATSQTSEATQHAAASSPSTNGAQSATTTATTQPPTSAEETTRASADGEDVRATPLARKLAQERGVDLTSIPGTGPGGRIREQDVLSHLNKAGQAAAAIAQEAAVAPAPQPAVPRAAFDRSVTRRPMSPLRQRVAQRLVEAQRTAAMLTTFN
ncbi:MAG: 2-oxoglutarate dehydrogenase, E2 component, dihydrolipoamide succinyltransferase, partial [Planctomycetota bacterium]